MSGPPQPPDHVDECVPAEVSFDMLEDMFHRNKTFTDYAREHSPRKSGDNLMPEAMLGVYHKKTEEDKLKQILEANVLEIRLMRVGIAMYGEVAEFMEEIPWKWWGRGAQYLNRHKALEEIIDLMHFLFIAVDDLGFTAKDFYEMYVKKNNHNWKRFTEKIGWGKTNKEHDDSVVDDIPEGEPIIEVEPEIKEVDEDE